MERKNIRIILWTSDCYKSESTCMRVDNFRNYRFENSFDCPLEHRHSVICVSDKVF